MASKLKLDDGVGALNQRQVDSANGLSSLFDKVVIDRSMVAGRDLIIRPARHSSKGPFMFNFPPDSEAYCMPGTIRLYGRYKVTQEDGTNLVAYTAAAGGAGAGLPGRRQGRQRYRADDSARGGR